MHRLDYATSGVMIVAKTNHSRVLLSKLFQKKLIQKTYLAVTIGKMPTSGTIEKDIHNKAALTEYIIKLSIPSEKFEFINLVEIKPQTGRRHQIRQHLNSIGFPICGDKIYNQQEKNIQGNGLYLHAYKIAFEHPILFQKISFEAKTPKKFNRLFGIR